MKRKYNLSGIFIFLSFLELLFLQGCTLPVNQNTVPENYQSYQIDVYNYSDFHYFLDTAYKNNFLDFAASGTLTTPENISRIVSTENLEVWIQTTNTTADRRMASLLIDLPPLPMGGNYDTSFYRPQIIQGKRYFGLFRKLTSSEYYINYQAGFIGVKTNLNENDCIGVSYRESGTDKRYGTSSTTFIGDTLVLKMIKSANIVPETDTLAWALKMKNIYRLPYTNISQQGFSFNIYYKDLATNVLSAELPNGASLLKLTGFDKFIGSGPLRGQDNLFDFLPGRTIYPEAGDVVFPVLRPFYDEIYSATYDTSYTVAEIYTKRKSEAVISPKASIYTIKVKIQTSN